MNIKNKLSKRTKRFILYSIYKPFRRGLYKIPNAIMSLFPMKNTLILESNPDMACNSYELYRYIVEHDELPGFNIIWLVSDPEKYRAKDFPDRVAFMDIAPKKVIDKIQLYYACNRSKILVDCNRHYRNFKTAKKQLNVYLDHGMPLKDMNNRYGVPLELYCDYVVSQASFFNPYLKQQYGVSDEQIFVGGVPRNDQFFKDDVKLSALYSDIDKFDKVIAWVPTFRQIMNNGRIDCVSDQPLGMPIIYTREDILSLEESLRVNNTLLIIKPHPVQDLSILKNLNYDNIRILYNEQMLACAVQTNEFLKQCDAMITDYSGIYYDYLLTDHPIAITLDDYEEYRSQKGFVFHDPLEILKGDYIFSLEDMKKFIESIHNGEDHFLEERKRIKELTNEFIDGNSTKRVFEFINKRYKEIWGK